MLPSLRAVFKRPARAAPGEYARGARTPRLMQPMVGGTASAGRSPNAACQLGTTQDELARWLTLRLETLDSRTIARAAADTCDAPTPGYTAAAAKVKRQARSSSGCEASFQLVCVKYDWMNRG